MRLREQRCEAKLLAPDGTVLATCTLKCSATWGLTAVDGIARLALWVQRAGANLMLTAADPEMYELLRLAGLFVQVEGEAEVGEEPLWVEQGEEEVHPRDLPA